MSVMASVRAVARESIPKPPSKTAITLTPKAVQRLSKIYYDHQPKEGSPSDSLRDSHKFIKIDMKSKGCSGQSYALNFTGKKKPLDEEVPIYLSSERNIRLNVGGNTRMALPNDSKKPAFSLLIDGRALFTIIGSQMDYVDDKLHSGFVFNNPNIKETCGCGLSFTV